MADLNVTPIRPPARETSYLRGVRTCVAMLEGICNADEFFVAGEHRRGAPQMNSVWCALQHVLQRGDDREFEGFCAVLTEICATADQHGDWSRWFGKYATRRERVLRRRYRGRSRPVP